MKVTGETKEGYLRVEMVYRVAKKLETEGGNSLQMEAVAAR